MAADGAHAELRYLYCAERSVRELGYETRNFTVPVTGAFDAGSLHGAHVDLLTYAAANLPPRARRLAAVWAFEDFPGSAQELRDAALIITEDLPDGAYDVALTMLDAGYTGHPEELLAVVAATVAQPARHATP